MGLFDGPPVTDAQRDLVAMTDARTREWYLEAEITMLNMRIAELEAALKPFADAAHFKVTKTTGTVIENSTWEIIVKETDLRQARKALGEEE